MSTSIDRVDSALAELVRFSLRALASKPARRLRHFLGKESQGGTEERTSTLSSAGAGIASYAAPLSPLRERDTTALADLFEREDLDEIEADVSIHLHWLWPEPCWEEEPLDFFLEESF